MSALEMQPISELQFRHKSFSDFKSPAYEEGRVFVRKLVNYVDALVCHTVQIQGGGTCTPYVHLNIAHNSRPIFNIPIYCSSRNNPRIELEFRYSQYIHNDPIYKQTGRRIGYCRYINIKSLSEKDLLNSAGRYTDEILKRIQEGARIVERSHGHELVSRILADQWPGEAKHETVPPGVQLSFNGRYDLVFERRRLIVEVDGAQHFGPIDLFGGVAAYETTRAHDAEKDGAALKAGFRVVRIRACMPGCPLIERDPKAFLEIFNAEYAKHQSITKIGHYPR